MRNLLLLLLGACAPGPKRSDSGDPSDTADPPPADTDDPVDDTDDPADDTGDPEPIPTDVEVCYLGADEAGTTCLPVVEHDPAWGEDYTYPEPLDDQYLAPARFIDLEDPSADPALQLAPNFQLSELMQVSKGRFALFQPHTLEALQAIRDSTGGPLIINSAYRSPGYNVGVDGSASHSRHMYGDAADMASSVASLDELGTLCEDLGAGYIGYYESHIHCDWRNEPLEPAFYDTGASAFAARPVHDARLLRDGDGWVAPASGFDEGEPLRRWTALDATGRVIEKATGRRYRPPAGTAELRVDVGGQVRLVLSGAGLLP